MRYITKNRGFTVLEAILAIFIVSLGLAGAATAVRTGLVGASIAKEQITAFYLAQEAVEILRNRRDENALKSYNGTPTGWLERIAELGDPCAPGNTCYINVFPGNGTLPPQLDVCTGSWGSCPLVKQNTTDYRYGYELAWVETPFRREIQIENIGANEVSVTVNISWMHGSESRSFKTKTLLMNWF